MRRVGGAGRRVVVQSAVGAARAVVPFRRRGTRSGRQGEGLKHPARQREGRAGTRTPHASTTGAAASIPLSLPGTPRNMHASLNTILTLAPAPAPPLSRARQVSARKPNAPKFGFGTASRFGYQDKLEKANCSPGPGAYSM